MVHHGGKIWKVDPLQYGMWCECWASSKCRTLQSLQGALPSPPLLAKNVTLKLYVHDRRGRPKAALKTDPKCHKFPSTLHHFPNFPHYKLSIDLKSREGSPRSLQFLSQLDPGAGAPNANAAARLQRPGIQIESWHGMARTSNALPMFNMYPYVQLSKHLATIGRMGNVENQDDPWK